ncbi:MAG TPA: cytidine deaminase [Pirellulaceae bacterium]|nr:cytidine deaminase [Pirellulaceae bacterium]
MHDARLIAAALAAREQAYAPYSHFLVGAALLSESGQIFAGCNVENVSLGLTNCAERVAIGTAIAAGQRKFTALAIASRGGVTPCGACRQMLAEFATELPIWLVDVDQPAAIVELSLQQLLPGRFTFDRDITATNAPDQS